MTTNERQTGATAGRKAARKAAVSIALLVLAIVVLFVWRPAGLNLWIKAIHVIAVIAWMAGLLYLPRLFVYHSDAAVGSELSETFKVMERRLLKVIMAPAMMVSWTLGLWLAYSSFGFSGGWLWGKILAVAGLTAFHVLLSRAQRALEADRRDHTARYWRGMNEVPTVLMLAAVIFVIVKPF